MDGNPSMEQALEILNRAASENKEEVERLLREKYGTIKETLKACGAELTEGTADTMKQVGQRFGEAFGAARDVAYQRSRDMAAGVDERVHQNPWTYVGVAAAAGLVVGLLIGRNNR